MKIGLLYLPKLTREKTKVAYFFPRHGGRGVYLAICVLRFCEVARYGLGRRRAYLTHGLQSSRLGGPVWLNAANQHRGADQRWWRYQEERQRLTGPIYTRNVDWRHQTTSRRDRWVVGRLPSGKGKAASMSQPTWR